MTFHVITIFPEIFNSYFRESILKRAQESGAIEIKIYNLRDWAENKHKTVDDTPYGGGAGMVMKIDVLYRALCGIRNEITNPKHQVPNKSQAPSSKLKNNMKVILLSAKGKTWNQEIAREYSGLEDIILICGRYEGADERITKFIDEEISIGDYVLTGGEVPAMAIVDSVARLLPGVLGNSESALQESYSSPGQLEFPQYTRPEVFKDENGNEHKVPDVLLSGNHAEIEKWREKNMKKRRNN